MNEEIVNQGYQDRMEGAEACHNPYPPGTIEHDEWLAGWENADCELEA